MGKVELKWEGLMHFHSAQKCTTTCHQTMWTINGWVFVLKIFLISEGQYGEAAEGTEEGGAEEANGAGQPEEVTTEAQPTTQQVRSVRSI